MHTLLSILMHLGNNMFLQDGVFMVVYLVLCKLGVCKFEMYIPKWLANVYNNDVDPYVMEVIS